MSDASRPSSDWMHRLKKWGKSRRFFYNLWYRFRNRRAFSDPFEHEKMLADGPRVEAYRAGIGRYVRPGDRVIDLGTGSGVLAFFASRAGAGRVYAVDHSPFIEHARRVAEANGLENIEFIRTNSRFLDLPERVDVIVQEQLGEFLLDENMVHTVTDLRDRLLKPGGRILPSRFELYVEAASLRGALAVPFIWNQRIKGLDFSSLRDRMPTHARYFRMPSRNAEGVEGFLCDPAPVLGVDLATVREGDLPSGVTYRRRAVRSGRLDGFVVYFRAHFDDEIGFTNAPVGDRAPSWSFWVLRVEGTAVSAGDVIDFRLDAGNWSDVDTWRWEYSVNPA